MTCPRFVTTAVCRRKGTVLMLGSHRILIGDVREQLKLLAPASVHCAVCSPPYWALRDYGVAGQIGSEATPDEFVQTLVDVFDGVRRVLRDDGTLWMNLGDSYASAWPCSRRNVIGTGSLADGTRDARPERLHGVKEGEQFLMPHRVAIAMQAAGWFLRSTIVWHKKSPMPESVSGVRWIRHKIKVSRDEYETLQHQQGREDKNFVLMDCPGCPKCSATSGLVLRRGKWRPTTAHEYVFLFSKSERYFCDGDAVQEMTTGGTHSRGTKMRPPKEANGAAGTGHGDWCITTPDKVETRNPRSVWTISSEPYKGPHFATFPSELAKRCILAGTSAGGCCASCGSPHAPVVVSERVPTRPGDNCKILTAHANRTDIDPATNWQNSTLNYGNRDPQRHVASSTIMGYRATCGCNAGIVPCTVLDPFLGSGTTVQVATHYGRDGIGIELNPEYAALAEARIATPPRCLIREQEKAGRKAAKRRKPMDAQKELF